MMIPKKKRLEDEHGDSGGRKRPQLTIAPERREVTLAPLSIVEPPAADDSEHFAQEELDALSPQPSDIEHQTDDASHSIMPASTSEQEIFAADAEPAQSSFAVVSAFEGENEEGSPAGEAREIKINAESLGLRNAQYETDYYVERPGFHNVGTPEMLVENLAKVGYQCLNFLAVQMSLLLNTPTTKIRALLLEGPSGCGKTYMAKSLAKICGAELMCLSCYEGMVTANLIEYPSTLAMANAMSGKNEAKAEELLNLGIITRAFEKSRTGPVILLIDELDKTHRSIDTFFLGPVQDARIWLESRPPVDADPENILVIFTKNYNRTLDEAFLRRCHPVKMTYLDSTLERKILSPHCHPQLVANLVAIADRMRNSGGSYAFERPPAPEELLTAALYVSKLLDWGMTDFGFVGKNIWSILAKSEHDRAVLEHMMRFHPDFMDPLIADGRDASHEDVCARLGRIVLFNLIDDPDKDRRERAWEEIDNY